MSEILRQNIDRIKIYDYIKVGKSKSKVNKKIHEQIKFVLLASLNYNSNEEVLVSINTSSYDTKVAFGNNEYTVMTPEMKEAIMNSTSSFVTIHNHPSNLGFSIGDLELFINKLKIQLMIVVTNDCKKCFALYKSSYINVKLSEYLLDEIDRYKLISNKTDGDDALPLIKLLINKVGLQYEEVVNYEF